MMITKQEDTQLLLPWKICAEYEDGSRLYCHGFSEEQCMQDVLDLEARHGSVRVLGGVCDEDYVDGEYVGRENLKFE